MIEEKDSALFNVSLEATRARLKSIGMDNYARTLKGHLHYLYFAMVSLVLVDVKNILELGTGHGHSTAIFSSLFPKAKVYTFDLPKEDRSYSTLAWRDKKPGLIKVFDEAIAKDNVIFVESNTFFLSSLKLPDLFELIWVDGGHNFPVVAWDIMFAYNHLRPGGFMFMHDYCLKPLSYTSQVDNVVRYMDGRIKEKIWLLPSSSKPEKSKCSKTVCIRKM